MKRKQAKGRTPKCWGYARASDPSRQLLSAERQHSQIGERARQIAEQTGAEIAHIRIDGASARTIRFYDRPEFKKLMDEIQPGDHLIIWRMDRLDRGVAGMMNAIQWCIDRNITLHILDHGNMQLDLDSYIGKAIVGFMAVIANMQTDQLSAAVKASVQWRRQQGYHIAGPYAPVLLKKIPVSRVFNGRRRKAYLLAWDEKQIAQAREIINRHDAGETWYSIAKDFLERGETTSDGQVWVSPARKADWYRCQRLKDAYTIAKRLEDAGLPLGCPLWGEVARRNDSEDTPHAKWSFWPSHDKKVSARA